MSKRFPAARIRLSQWSHEITEKLKAEGPIAISHEAARFLVADLKKAEDRLYALELAEEALAPFVPGAGDGVWGRIKAHIVNGAPTREQGIALARQITEWQTAIPTSAYPETRREP